jgi:hypothetical protein
MIEHMSFTNQSVIYKIEGTKTFNSYEISNLTQSS